MVAIEGAALEPRVKEILDATTVFRLLTLMWAFAVCAIDTNSKVLAHPAVAFGGLAVLTAWTATLAIHGRGAEPLVLRPFAQVSDLCLAALTLAADGALYGGPHPQSFGSAWPVAALISVAALRGWKTGAIAGFGLGIANIAGAAAAHQVEGRGLALCGSLVLLIATGAVAGYVTNRLRVADNAVAAANAREEFARTLHDGVLQTLAVIQRRSTDNQLIALAKSQEAELRSFIRSANEQPATLLSSLREVISRVELRHGVTIGLVIIEPAELNTERSAALAGAVGEALTNAAKHADASAITVSVDRVGADVAISVVDDGLGFDPVHTPHGTGLDRSITARINEIGGTVVIRSKPGGGTEVAFRIPTGREQQSR